jgi:hypothetical protein
MSTNITEINPWTTLFGVWGRILILFSCISLILFVGSFMVGWPYPKFITHTLMTGVLLLVSRPNYSLELSKKYLPSTTLTNQHIIHLKQQIQSLYANNNNNTKSGEKSSSILRKIQPRKSFQQQHYNQTSTTTTTIIAPSESRFTKSLGNFVGGIFDTAFSST